MALAVLAQAGEAFFGPAFGALVPEIVAPSSVEANPHRPFPPGLERLSGRRWAASWSPPSAEAAFLIDAGTFATSRGVHLGPAGALAARAQCRALGAPRAREAVVFVRS